MFAIRSRKRNERERIVRTFIITFVALLCVAPIASAQVTANALYNVVKVRVESIWMSGFVVEVDGRQYLITARHLLDGKQPTVCDLELWHENAWQSKKATVIYPASPRVDIVAMDLGGPITMTGSSHPLNVGSGTVGLGQQIYFLGFPYDLSTRGNVLASPGMDELAFIKSGVLSALDIRDPDAVVIYLDGHNNPGFSGGPIVYMHKKSLKVLGVIKGFAHVGQPVVKKKDLNNPKASAHEDLFVSTNTGIVVGYSVRHIIEAIRRHTDAVVAP